VKTDVSWISLLLPSVSPYIVATFQAIVIASWPCFNKLPSPLSCKQK